jgi:hypothetical protein
MGTGVTHNAAVRERAGIPLPVRPTHRMVAAPEPMASTDQLLRAEDQGISRVSNESSGTAGRRNPLDSAAQPLDGRASH